MNKIAVYMNEHLLGEVSSAKSIRKQYSTDGSILNITPEVVAFPRVTNDVRKIARFTWQLAEKGHVVGMTARGLGGDVTGAAIGKGIVIDTSARLNRVLQVAAKDKLVHVQAGANLNSVDQTLKWQGLSLKGVSTRNLRSSTVGGAIASDDLGDEGYLADSVDRLEVILANGDVIETNRISKREVSRRLGLQTLEGEIYRKLEGLIEDNEEVIARLAADPTRDNAGYKRLSKVRGKDGSFDLTPLFIGSQGTLGIISEVVMKVDFYSAVDTHAVVIVESMQAARDLGEKISGLNPAELTIFDGSLFRRASKQGSKFGILGEVDQLGAVVYVRLNDFNERVQTNKLKRLRKSLAKMKMGLIDSTERDIEDFKAIVGINQTLSLGTGDEGVAMSIIDGAFIPVDRREEFEDSIKELAAKHHVELPVELDALRSIYTVYPILKIDSVSDKQKLFKLLNDYAATVDRCSGVLIADGAEGRLKANAAWSNLDEQQADIYAKVREIFDPYGTLNPGVKQKSELRSLVALLRPSFEASSVL